MGIISFVDAALIFFMSKKPTQILLFSVMNQQRSDTDPDPALIDQFYVWRIRTSKSLKHFKFQFNIYAINKEFDSFNVRTKQKLFKLLC